ncbi:hypothetical protein BJ508DRAFT_304694 [Ascobolus immersus RN42]|uniref:CBM-cenC domain-containing protein n=1 Tax=Ascobolus immersus RN42 TaxID=1160509 RepID=A0A3N4IFQ5_ASCIM|nr:hypothetical protein BJ508DRAFT_304694 [Ascobolus immersus RN42]
MKLSFAFVTSLLALGAVAIPHHDHYDRDRDQCRVKTTTKTKFVPKTTVTKYSTRTKVETKTWCKNHQWPKHVTKTKTSYSTTQTTSTVTRASTSTSISTLTPEPVTVTSTSTPDAVTITSTVQTTLEPVTIISTVETTPTVTVTTTTQLSPETVTVTTTETVLPTPSATQPVLSNPGFETNDNAWTFTLLQGVENYQPGQSGIRSGRDALDGVGSGTGAYVVRTAGAYVALRFSLKTQVNNYKVGKQYQVSLWKSSPVNRLCTFQFFSDGVTLNTELENLTQQKQRTTPVKFTPTKESEELEFRVACIAATTNYVTVDDVLVELVPEA